MKKFFTLISVLFALNSFSQDCNIGNDVSDTASFNGDPNFSINYILGTKYSLSQAGILNSINLYGRGTFSDVIMYVYDDLAGVPNNLIATSALGSVGNGAISLAVTATALPAGDYWIMANYLTSGDHTYGNGAGNNPIYFTALTFGLAAPSNASSFSNYAGADFMYYLEIECDNSLSINNLEESNNISLFPNPANELVQLTGLEIGTEIQISSLNGNLVHKATALSSEMTIETMNIEGGVYLVKFINLDNRIVTKKLAINK